MCRWVAYRGAPVFLEDFVSRPCQSLVAQSRRSREAKVEVNADGFGIGWYGERERPGLFRDVRPAWNDENLLSIAHQIRSRLFFAHVRASTGTATTRANCHPFALEACLFMHNGQIGGWDRLRRRLELEIADDLFAHRSGTTDSEAMFLIAMGLGLARDPAAALEATLGLIEAEMARSRVEEPLRVTAVVSDGRDLVAVRYASDGEPPTLYTHHCPETGGMLLVSEPLDDVRHGWSAVPAQSLVTVTAAGLRVEPFAPRRHDTGDRAESGGSVMRSRPASVIFNGRPH